MNQHNVRSKYSPRIGVVVECGEDGPTQQHFKDQCDINKIARMQEATGSIEHVKQGIARYGNFEEYFDVAGNMDKASKAQQLWEQVPVELRKKTGNSIPEFFDYIQQEENFNECVKWGIYNPPKEKALQPPEPIPPGSTKTGKPKPTPKVHDESPDTE